MKLLPLVYMGFYHGTCEANVNLVDKFKETEKEKHPELPFYSVRKIAIEAPAQTEITINDVDIVMPSTGVFELGLDYVPIDILIFKEAVDVNIIYMY